MCLKIHKKWLVGLPLKPSRADSLRHGYAMLTRFFPGGRDELAAIDDELMLELLGKAPDSCWSVW